MAVSLVAEQGKVIPCHGAKYCVDIAPSATHRATEIRLPTASSKQRWAPYSREYGAHWLDAGGLTCLQVPKDAHAHITNLDNRRRTARQRSDAARTPLACSANFCGRLSLVFCAAQMC